MKTTLLVTIVIFVSKAGGFLREIVMTAYYGASADMDAYNMAYTLFYIPVLLFNSCITSTLVPLYVKKQQAGDVSALNRFSSNVITIFALFSAAVSAVMFLLAKPLVSVTAMGFSPEIQSVTTRLLRIMLPSLAFIVVSIVLASILNARESYLAAQLTGFPLTICLLAATFGFSHTAGITALAWGVFAAGVGQVMVLLPFLRKQISYAPSLDLKDETFRRLMVLAGPAVLSMAVNELNHMVDKMLATGLPEGYLSCMSLAFRLITFLVGVVLVPLETISFSRMSMRTAANDRAGVGAIVMKCAELVALIILPVIAIGAIMSKDVIRLAYMHGRFDEAAVETAARALVFYIIGVFSFGMRDILNRAFHACQDTRTPMINSMATVAVNVVLNILLVKPMNVGGLALATSVSATVGVISLLTLLRRKIGKFDSGACRIELMKILMCAIVCAVVCFIFNKIVPGASTAGMSFVRLVSGTLISGAVYAICALALKVDQIKNVISQLKARFHR